MDSGNKSTLMKRRLWSQYTTWHLEHILFIHTHIHYAWDNARTKHVTHIISHTAANWLSLTSIPKKLNTQHAYFYKITPIQRYVETHLLPTCTTILHQIKSHITYSFLEEHKRRLYHKDGGANIAWFWSWYPCVYKILLIRAPTIEVHVKGALF